MIKTEPSLDALAAEVESARLDLRKREREAKPAQDAESAARKRLHTAQEALRVAAASVLAGKRA